MIGSFCGVEIWNMEAERAANDEFFDPDRHAVVPDDILPNQEGGRFLQGKFPVVKDLVDYHRATRQFRETGEEFARLFRHFLYASSGRKCLRLAFNVAGEAEPGANWVARDLDEVECAARESGRVVLDFEDGDFDLVLCTGLEQVSRPAELVAEIARVLRDAGQVWVQVRLCAPYLPENGDGRSEYWRMTPDGLRVLLKDFDEILCSVFQPQGSALRNCSFFYGLKPSLDASAESP